MLKVILTVTVIVERMTSKRSLQQHWVCALANVTGWITAGHSSLWTGEGEATVGSSISSVPLYRLLI
jgi:hypothetical protein